MDAQTLASTGISALMLSAIYILMALGFALLLSVMGVLNFAHSALYMVAGYICYEFTVGFGLSGWLSLILTVVVMGAFGVFLERFCFRPFFGDTNRIIVIALALIVILESLMNILVGTAVRKVPDFISGTIKFSGFQVSQQRILVTFIGAAVLIALIILIQNTRRGQQMLAVAQDFVGATLQGINIYRTMAFATVIACALAALAGSLGGAVYYLNPFIGDQMLVKAIEVVILAGIGSISGVFAGGLILGIIDAFLPMVLSGVATDATGLGIVVLILLFRPQGLFGHEA